MGFQRLALRMEPAGIDDRGSEASAASSVPVSSNVSRTAAHTSARAVAGATPNVSAHHGGACPDHVRRGLSGPSPSTSPGKSRASTPPPGNTVMFGANFMVLTRSCT